VPKTFKYIKMSAHLPHDGDCKFLVLGHLSSIQGIFMYEISVGRRKDSR
jgi:hypothetical protein